VFPDVYVVVGVPQQGKGPFRAVVHGRPPSAAFEFSVPDSLGMDRHQKRERYLAMGVPEYYVFDVEAREVPGLLEGWALEDGVYRPLAPVPSPRGGRRLASAVLGLELEPVTDPRCPEGYALRAFRPGAAEPLPTFEEAERDAAAAERDAAERRVAELEDRLRRFGGE